MSGSIEWHRSAAGALMLLAFGAALAAVPGDRPGDYSHVTTVGVSGRQGVVQLRLPREVYLASRSRELADLRLFDANGASLPFALADMAPPAREGRAVLPAALFPVSGSQSGRKWLDHVSIETSGDGVVTAVAMRDSASRSGDTLSGLVLDLHPDGLRAETPSSIDAIILTPPSGLGNYSARIMVESSEDLQDWDPLAEGVVSWLGNEHGQRVRQDRIEFAPRAFRYARMRWLEGNPVSFSRVTAEHITRQVAADMVDMLTVPARRGSSGRDLLYAVSPALPVETVGLSLEGKNAVFPASIGFYETLRGSGGGGAEVHFRSVVTATFFRLTQDGRLRTSADVRLAPTHAAQWVVRPQGNASDMPALRLGWHPASMIFVATGQGPFTLGVGRDGAQPHWVPLVQVAPGFSAAELATLEHATAGPMIAQLAPSLQHATGLSAATGGVV